MSRDDFIAAQLLRPAQQRFKLHAPVALDAGVRRAPTAVVGGKRQHDALSKAIGKVKNIVRHPQPVGDGAGVLHIVERAAGVSFAHTGVLVRIELHRAADALIPLALRKVRRDGRIDAAAHGNQRFHGFLSSAFFAYYNTMFMFLQERRNIFAVQPSNRRTRKARRATYKGA